MMRSLVRKTARKLRNVLRPATPGKNPGPRPARLSLVVPTYNAEPWLDRLLHSIFTQTSHLRRFEVIIVDDGSTDGSATIAKEWQRRYPGHIHYVYQKNAGPAVARNTGMALATGTWITFPDPDDFLDKDYFRKMLKETEVKHEKPLLAVSANLIPYYEATDKFVDNHPLRYRFRKGIVRRSTSDLKDHMQLNVASCWLHRETISRQQLSFDPRVIPGSEDTQFINRLLLRAPHRTITFLPAARYYYRKRITKDSLVTTGHLKPEWYLDQIRYGVLDLLHEAKRGLGHVPYFLQRACLYVIVWKFRHVVEHPERTTILTTEERAEFVDLLGQVMDFIEPPTIAGFNLADCTEEHKVALLWRYKKLRRDTVAVYLKDMDSPAGIVQFSYIVGGNDNFTITPFVNGRAVEVQLPSQRRKYFMGDTWFQERFFWVEMGDGDEVNFKVEDKPCRIRYLGNALGERATWQSLRAALTAAPNVSKDPETQRLRNYVREMRDLYRDCYVLMDSDDRADDNAEHLCRHMMHTGKADNAYFILRRESPDWGRLEEEGFKLLEFQSDNHIAALMNASVLASSHADHFVLWPIPRSNFSDLSHYKFVFLQHGVITNNLAIWLNTRPIRLFITTTPAERESILQDVGDYKFTVREVIHSGLPRHDRLWAAREGTQARTILIMPTWRKYLTDEPKGSETRRDKIRDFTESKYWLGWEKVLKSSQLRAHSERHGAPVVFLPHPNMAIYLDEMDIPEWISAVDIRDGRSYQTFLANAKVAITDFSSTASEVAFLQRPVIYFQFDADEMFSGGHVCTRGYFSYEDDGFGPVEATADGVLNRLEQALSGQEDPVYAARRDAAFPFRDGKCCERVMAAIDRLNTPRPRHSPLYASQGVVDSPPAVMPGIMRQNRLHRLAGR